MKEYVQELFDKFPALRKQILSVVSKHMSGKVTLLNELVKAAYATEHIDQKHVYQALYGFIKETIGKEPVLPRAQYFRSELQAGNEAALTQGPAQMLYRGLEEKACQIVDFHFEEWDERKIQKALDYMIQCATGYESAYSSNKIVKSHADKTRDIITSLNAINESELSLSAKFKEMQRLLRMEIQHKDLKDKEGKYLNYLANNWSADNLDSLLSSKDFIKSGSSFAKALLAILKYSEEFESKIGLNQNLEDRLNDRDDGYYHEYIAMLCKNVNISLFHELFSSKIKDPHELQLMNILSPLIIRNNSLSDDQHKEIYLAVRNYLIHTKDEGYQRALIEMLTLEDKTIDDVVKFVIASEEAQRIMKQFEGLVIPQEIIEKKIDAEEQELLFYTIDSALRTIRSICSEQKELSKELSNIISNKGINALEKMEALKSVLQIRGESKLSSRDIPNLEEELAAYDYRVLGQNDHKTILLRSVRGLNEAKAKEYVVRALQSVVISYEKEILSKFPKSDYVPELNVGSTVVAQRARAMSTKLRGHSFVSSASEGAALSPKVGSSPGDGYDPTLFGRSKGSSGSNTPEKEDSPTHRK